MLASSILLLATVAAASAQGNVGCLFSKAVCLDDVEWCFDDYAFGRCHPHYGDDDPSDLFRFQLRRDELHFLEREMEKLFALGYRWTHQYTQCVLQQILAAIRDGEDYDSSDCAPLSDQDLNAALKALEGDEEQHLDPNRLAHVKFTPSVEDPHADFADEFYVPKLDEFQDEPQEGFPENVIKGQGPPAYADYQVKNAESSLRRLIAEGQHLPKKRQRSYPYEKQTGIYPITTFLTEPSMRYNDRYDPQDAYNQKDFEENERAIAEALAANVRSFSKSYNTPDKFRLGLETKDVNSELSGPITAFSRNYNTPENFRKGFETRDGDDSYLEAMQKNVYASPDDRQYLFDAYREGPEDSLSHDLQVLADEEEDGAQNTGNIYTEGGTLYLNRDDKETISPELEKIVKDLGGGFKRPERLDVKKPGPNFKTNNYAFKVEKEAKEAEEKSKEMPTSSTGSNQETPATVTTHRPIVVEVVKKKVGSPLESPSRKAPQGDDEDTFAYIQFKNGKPLTWNDGVAIIRSLAKLLKMDGVAFTHPRVGYHELKFKVDGTKSDLNASEVAKRIDGIKDQLKEQFGWEVAETGYGDKSRQPTALNLTSAEEHQIWLLSFLLCGVLAAVAIAGAAFFVVKRHARTRDKLNGLAQPDYEASKDYQDLCRARMANKAAQEKPENGGGRISALCKEGETNQSPSSRSSTSSWSEEPALTNMDISTGHMVLSYMEDHLKNKDRLEQEWIALCAYEAEPCATTVAVSQENIKKNRYPDVLPYDHARVILNELLNVSGSDYINASTITDHDPRNPAYIATQGPLQNTAADLWQMVWEQGSVVMVMLTRLSENGTSLCHRYWPEEGSEVYHIYEVHLVSEHIWCDDYLVRSFYLKNLRTGETRTVTQFHFLSWPESGVPLSTKALLEFRRKVNKSYRGRSCPIVVHCSDGIGRTGTYCLIDMVLNRMTKGAKEIDIAATLEHIRDQRPLMVKTKQQFEFVLMAVAEEVHAILKALPATHSPPPVVKEKE